MKLKELLCEKVDFRERDMKRTEIVGSEFVGCTFSDNFGPVTSVLVIGQKGGELIVAGMFSDELRIWTGDGRAVGAFSCGEDWISELIVDRMQGGTLLFSCMDGTVHGLDVQTQSVWPLASYVEGKKIRAIFQTSVGAVWTACDDGAVRIILGRHDTVTLPVSERRLLSLCGFASHGNEFVVAAGDDAFLYLCDAVNRKVLQRIDLGGETARDPGGRALALEFPA